MGLLSQIDGFGRPPGARVEALRDSGGGERRGTIVAVLSLAFLVLILGAGLYFGSRQQIAGERAPATGCLVNAPTPSSTLAMLDVTDQLAAGSGERFSNLITQIRDNLDRDARLTIVPFGGDLGQSLVPVFDRCSPGRGSQADGWNEGPHRVERDYQNGFAARVSRAADRLRSATSSPQSPIATQIERAVSDPAIVWTGANRRLVLLTDGLENTASSRVYVRGRITLPPPRPGLLAGVTVDYVELVNPRHHTLQTSALREAWREWFLASGAERVNMYAAGYARSQ